MGFKELYIYLHNLQNLLISTDHAQLLSVLLSSLSVNYLYCLEHSTPARQCSKYGNCHSLKIASNHCRGLDALSLKPANRVALCRGSNWC